MTRSAMVTGATGYVGSKVVQRLLEHRWRVTVLVRDRDKLEAPWDGDVRVVEGDASDREALARAMEGADVAWFLIHSMGEGKDFAQTELDIAHAFADSARDCEVGRIIYLGGLHPEGEELSEHLASRVAVGEVLLNSGVPTAALQAGVLIGAGSPSFELLRTLTERLPGAFGPRWLKNRIQPIDAHDAVHYLVAAADLDPAVNRAFDIAGPDRLSYAEMMQRYAKVLGIGPRPVLTLPVMTPRMAAQWIAMISSMSAPMAAPLIGSLLHDTVASENDLDDLVGGPEGGCKGFDEAVRGAADGSKPWRFAKILGATSAAVAASAAVGFIARNPKSQPPGWVLGLLWPVMYGLLATQTALHFTDRAEAGEDDALRRDQAALTLHLMLNAGWSWTHFHFRRRTAATAVAAALAASSADLVRRIGARRQRGVLLSPYAVWTSLAILPINCLRRSDKFVLPCDNDVSR